ncbi:hypothetical protein EOI86_18415 [Hwanghaeella grinnelliae]|uniref:Uncharacterized protein n=1 Tax=Hwanghaeella grinnelliae TaxID=2500179 RepID=A0A3S2W310_9PROT|nr:hypothetical protein [Hwanghaeella grinnelliae]RVU34819.1 hypothetical protein EOI86_18415 [Hwanghaeella grinnelliae]
MVSSITGQNGSLQLLKSITAQTDAREKRNDGEDSSLLGILNKLDPEKAETLKEKLEEAKEAQAHLDSVKKSASDQRKAAAAEKIARIKAQIKALQLLASANPEAAARLAARLARELASAVKAYAAAGGQNAGSIGGAGGTSVSPSAQPSADAAAGGVTAGAEGAAQGTQGADATVVQSANQAEAQAKAVAAQGNQSKAGAGQKPGEKADGTPFSEQKGGSEKEQSQPVFAKDDGSGRDGQGNSIRERVQAQLQKGAEAFGAAKADQEFVNEVRQIKTALKGIIEAAKKALEAKKNSDPSLDKEIEDAEKALKEIDGELSEISTNSLAGITAATGLVNVVA